MIKMLLQPSGLIALSKNRAELKTYFDQQWKIMYPQWSCKSDIQCAQLVQRAFEWFMKGMYEMDMTQVKPQVLQKMNGFVAYLQKAFGGLFFAGGKNDDVKKLDLVEKRQTILRAGCFVFTALYHKLEELFPNNPELFVFDIQPYCAEESKGSESENMFVLNVIQKLDNLDITKETTDSKSVTEHKIQDKTEMKAEKKTQDETKVKPVKTEPINLSVSSSNTFTESSLPQIPALEPVVDKSAIEIADLNAFALPPSKHKPKARVNVETKSSSPLKQGKKRDITQIEQSPTRLPSAFRSPHTVKSPSTNSSSSSFSSSSSAGVSEDHAQMAVKLFKITPDRARLFFYLDRYHRVPLQEIQQGLSEVIPATKHKTIQTWADVLKFLYVLSKRETKETKQPEKEQKTPTDSEKVMERNELEDDIKIYKYLLEHFRHQVPDPPNSLEEQKIVYVQQLAIANCFQTLIRLLPANAKVHQWQEQMNEAETNAQTLLSGLPRSMLYQAKSK